MHKHTRARSRQVKSGDDVSGSAQMALRRLMTKGHSVHNRVAGADLNCSGLERPHAVNDRPLPNYLLSHCICAVQGGRQYGLN
jgi:hypothetical protein